MRSSAGLVAGALAALLAASPRAAATPNLPLDDPAYDVLDRARAFGLIPTLGGLGPLTEARVGELLLAAGQPLDPALVPPDARGPWLRPARRLTLRLRALEETARPYSTAVHPRWLAGGVSLSCEREEGRPCGGGAGVIGELDSSAGWGRWGAAFARVRLTAGAGAYEPAAELDRAYGSLELGPLAAQAGRDAVALGPLPARTRTTWSAHAPPLDHVRLATSRPLALPGGLPLRVQAAWFVGRLRAPQTFDGTLVEGIRLGASLLDRAEVGLSRLMQFGGEGAPPWDLQDFVLEHLRRRHMGQLGFANHRGAADLAAVVPALGLRLTYELTFEDVRADVGATVLRDSDHALAAELPALAGTRHGLLLELHATGVRSHEHQLFHTGLTNAGRVLGDPLGPGARAAFAGLRLAVGSVGARAGRPPRVRDGELAPWAEVAWLSSDTYFYENGPIERIADGPTEVRLRGGLRAAGTLAPGVRLEVRGLLERVGTADFVPGRARWHGGAEAILVWTPCLALPSP